jgi:hypothetical protein
MNRKEVIEFLDNIETYNKVLNIIKDECRKNDVRLNDYSIESYIAGGAVANTIHNLINKDKPNYRNTKPIINDIDLFCFTRGEGLNWSEPAHNDGQNFISQTINPTLNMDGYGRTWLGTMGESITMTNSERFGLINKIGIQVYLNHLHDFKVTDYYPQLLNNFDLNCCSAGIDRLNGKIIYTDKFVDFLVNNQIEVIMISSPLQTSIRMLKKSKELNTNTNNFETEMSLLQHSFVNGEHKYMGLEWWDKAKKYGSFLSNYFQFTSKTGYLVNNLFQYTTKNFEIVKYFDQFKFNSESSMISFWDLFVRKKNQESLNKLITFYVQNTSFSLGPREGVKFSLIRKRRRKLRTVNVSFDFIDTLGFVPQYLDCDFSLEDLVKVNRFNKMLDENFIDPRICLTNNIKSHIKFIKFFTNKFIDVHGSIKMRLLNNVITKVEPRKRLELSTLNCDDKISSFVKVINNLWFNMSDSYRYRHRFENGFNQQHEINLNDLEF